LCAGQDSKTGLSEGGGDKKQTALFFIRLIDFEQSEKIYLVICDRILPGLKTQKPPPIPSKPPLILGDRNLNPK